MALSTEAELREKLRKIRALFEGASTPGEREAAAAAMARLQRTLGNQTSSSSSTGSAREEPRELLAEMQITLPDRWQRRLFMALCRRYGIKPYRYKRQRHTTVMVRVARSLFDRTLWPEYLELRDALNEYLSEATERIVREEVFGDAGEADER